MATVEELGRGAVADEQSSRHRKYAVTAAASEADALAAVAAKIITDGITTLGGLTLRNIRADEDSVVPNCYRCEATWGSFQRRTPPAVGESQFNFEIGTQPVKVVMPTGTITVYKQAADTNALPTIQLVGDTGDPDNPPEGAEIFEPAHTESETHYLDAADIVAGYKSAIKGVVGKINNASFKGHDPGEALCVGVSGSKRGANDWEVTFRWQVRENQSGLSIAGITGITKRGWDFLWPIAKPTSDGGTLRRKVTHICVAPVFREADFSALGIGT